MISTPRRRAAFDRAIDGPGSLDRSVPTDRPVALDRVLRDEVAGALARGYAAPANSAKVPDPTLVNAMLEEVMRIWPHNSRPRSMTDIQVSNADLHEKLTGPAGPDRDLAVEAFRYYMTMFQAENSPLRGGPPRVMATIDGVPVYDTDVYYASRHDMDVRLLVASRAMAGGEAEDPPARQPARQPVQLEAGQRHLEL